MVSLRRTYLASFLRDSEDIKSLSVRTLVKEHGSEDLGSDYGAQSSCF